MGADGWVEFSSKHKLPLDALREIQVEYFKSYNLEKTIHQELEYAKQGLIDTEVDDEYFLREFHIDRIKFLEPIITKGLPKEIVEQINLLRTISNWYSGIGNILDIVGICKLDHNYPYTSRPLNNNELITIFSNIKPTRKEVTKTAGFILGTLDRGESNCFAYYDDDRNAMEGWCFVGLTID